MLQNKLWDVKERTHCSQRVGHVVPGVVVYLDLCRRRSGWVRCDHNGLKRLPEAPLICWRPISPLWFLCNSALGCKWGKLAPFIYSSSSIHLLISSWNLNLTQSNYPERNAVEHYFCFRLLYWALWMVERKPPSLPIRGKTDRNRNLVAHASQEFFLISISHWLLVTSYFVLTCCFDHINVTLSIIIRHRLPNSSRSS